MDNEIKRSNVGIDNGYLDMSILMYADDTALVSDSTLCSVINKSKQIGYFKYNSYSTSFLACISPILDYCSGIWGFKQQSMRPFKIAP